MHPDIELALAWYLRREIYSIEPTSSHTIHERFKHLANLDRYIDARLLERREKGEPF